MILHSMSSSTKILIGLLAGVFVGLFFGEDAAVLKVVADGFVKLLQMSVLPYITLSIVTSLGTLSFDQVKTLGLRAGAVVIGLWCFALVFTFLIPLAFPAVETASFFSTNLVEPRRPFNFVDLFIPSNPFYSLANNIVPAVVLFSVFLGVALIALERKQTAVDIFAVTKEALSRVTKFVVGLTPYGIFAIDRLPFVFLNGEGELVGFDVEMAHLLARDLGVKAEFVEMQDLTSLPRLLMTGRRDVAMTGMPVTPERAGEMRFSDPYLDETLAFVVKDHLREQFSSWANVRKLVAPVAIPNLPYYVDRIKARAPALKLQVVDTIKQIEDGLKQGTLDAVALPAERGSVMTLLYPKYTVVVPEPGVVKIPLAYPVAHRDHDWAYFLNTWIDLKRRDGTIDALYGHWILGKQAGKSQPRWSIMRNVLHWVELWHREACHCRYHWTKVQYPAGQLYDNRYGPVR